MKLPKGVFIDRSNKPLADVLRERSHSFKGLIHVYNGMDMGAGEGFIMVDDGSVLASAYSMMGITFYQLNALDRLMALNDVTSEIFTYDDHDQKALFYSYPDSLIAGEPVKKAEPALQKPEPVTGEQEKFLASLLSQEGVTAAALVADGFPVYQAGKHVDFEHVAVATEDMLRAGARIASELQLGVAGQIILETSENKVIIAQAGDMLLCVLTKPEVSLGMIRLIIKNSRVGQEDV